MQLKTLHNYQISTPKKIMNQDIFKVIGLLSFLKKDHLVVLQDVGVILFSKKN